MNNIRTVYTAVKKIPITPQNVFFSAVISFTTIAVAGVFADLIKTAMKDKYNISIGGDTIISFTKQGDSTMEGTEKPLKQIDGYNNIAANGK